MIKFRKSIYITAIIALIICFFYYQNNHIVLSKYLIVDKKIPAAFNDFKIVQISDFHNTAFYNNNEALISKIKAANPDIIVITGDLIDSRRYNEDKALKLIDSINKIAPLYYVPGNHEARSEKYSELSSKLKALKVISLENSHVMLNKGSDSIDIIGIYDPLFKTNYNLASQVNKDLYTILLSHRPELTDYYTKSGANLVFSGHAHGGQIILPFLGGLIAPHQGLFPKYYKGIYKKHNTNMIVSRGLGNSLFPLRLFNYPEIVEVILKV